MWETGIFRNKEDVIKKLAELDFELEDVLLSDKLEFVIFGGTALLLWSDSRVTGDIDVVMINEFSSEKVTELLSKHNVNNRIEKVMEIPPASEFLPRAKKINVPFRNIRVFLASVEDLIISKLFSSRQSDRDEKDLIEYNFLDEADKDKLWELYEYL